MLSQTSTTGRRVYFESEKQKWLDHVRNGGNNKREAEQRMDMTYGNDEVRAEVSEWFEHRLRDWEQVLPALDSKEDPDDDGLPAYFALSVAAAGWHSGALVLHNEEKARKVRERYQQRTNAPEEGQFAAPEASESLLEQTTSMLMALGRSFLGLPQAGAHDEQPSQEPSWIWENETFPRLRLKNGEVMPGDVPVEEWTCSEWREVEGVEQPQEEE